MPARSVTLNVRLILFLEGIDHYRRDKLTNIIFIVLRKKVSFSCEIKVIFPKYPIFFLFSLILMEKHEVVPDIIDVVPEHVAEIAWSDDVMTNMGNELTPTQVG